MAVYTMQLTQDNGVLTITLDDRIDTSNANGIRDEIFSTLESQQPSAVVLDAGSLNYISSAGIRVVIGLLKRLNGKVSLIDASPDVYNVFEMTGVSQMMEVHKRLREVSLDNATFLNKGGNGEIWRLDPETVIKVYNPGAALDKIRRENDVARVAFTSGLPCAIPFDTVRVGDRYGIVFELLDAETVGHTVSKNPERVGEFGRVMGELMREMHHTKVDSPDMPRMTEKANAWIDYLAENYLEADDAALMRSVVEAIPETETLLHLDFHEGNVMIQDDELVLIDLDDMCIGNPLYDLVAHWVGHVMSPQTTPEATEKSFGMSAELTTQLFYPTMQAYFGTDDAQVIERHNQTMQLFSLFFVMLYLAKGKDSSNLTPERIQGVLQQILPQFRQFAPQIIQVAGSYRF
ncbi:MAG: anti-sigma factor antagonist [Coriobacteriales bacterium]|nr:anti-sigma factor antagonist [Coriobacteriales bacterium]